MTKTPIPLLLDTHIWFWLATGDPQTDREETDGDPADRIIVASARHVGARLLTRDRRILDYAAGGFADVLAV